MPNPNRFIQDHIGILKAATWVACLIPLAMITLGAFSIAGQSLGANPVETLIHQLGIWGLRLLLITLAVTPLRQLSGVVALTRFRRLLGLFAFFYILMHFLAYAWVDQRWDLDQIIEDILERPFITIGITALLLLIPLVVTSTNRMRRRLGRRWQALHRAVYVIAILGVWHFWWQVKLDVLDPAVYAGILLMLLGWRVWVVRRRRQSA